MEVVGSVKNEFQKCVDHPHIKRLRPPILIYLSKNESDFTSTDYLTITKIETLLNLDQVREHHRIKISYCNGLTGSGVVEGFEWLAERA